MVKGLSRRLSDDTRNFLIKNVFFKISHLSENREVGRLESRLLLSDNEWREFKLANIEPLNALRKKEIINLRRKYEYFLPELVVGEDENMEVAKL